VLPSAFRDNVGSQDVHSYGARSHGLPTRCLRFVIAVTCDHGRRRDVPYGAPPPRIPAYGVAIPGSCLRSERQAAVASLTDLDDRFGLVVASA
jgi:hypothetical protein